MNIVHDVKNNGLTVITPRLLNMFCNVSLYCITNDCVMHTIHYTVGVAKIFRFTCTLFWNIPTYSRTLARSFSEK